MKKNEKVNDFCERFDQIIREYDSCGDGEKLTEQEIRSAFYQAITPVTPQLMFADFLKISQSKEMMTLNEMKSFILQLEAEKKTGDGDDTVKAQIAKFDSKTRCYRCAKTGRRIEDCPLSKDLWFCYFCQDIKNQKGAECKEGRLKSKILNNDNIKSRGKVDRRGFIKDRNNVNSKPYNNDRRFKNCNKNNQQSAQNAPKRDSRSAKRVTDERQDDTDESEVDLQRKEGDSENIEVKDSSIRNEEEVTTPPEIEQHPENPDDDMFNWDSSLITENTIKLDDIESIKNLEELFTSNPLEQGTTESSKINEAMLWHVRLGHASLNYLKKLQKVYSKLEKVRFDDSILDCEICIMSKMQKLPFKEVRRRASRPLQIIHTDTMGPIKQTSHPGHKRFINVYIDDYYRLARAYPVKTKDESGETLEKFLISTRNLVGKDEKV
ncbi:uncharacterized protein LOC123267988 [Cotesia glomerata]|uniref:uncharacterized protein LOC123267988 n=1 Tax=Cotesia glomerata TaxID=32391 RepID=UPI001D029474|nr:uncharacterized protein LOC123267988 [Cotesia glomerata]